MNPLKQFFLIAFLFTFFVFNAQEKKKFKINTIAFYNLENLFDSINDPVKFDEASPIMEMKSGRGEAYKKKIHNMARVISDIGADEAKNSPAIIGVSEVENRNVSCGAYPMFSRKTAKGISLISVPSIKI